MNELEIIEKLCRGLPTNASTVVGPGDDCAVLDLGIPGRYLLLKTDAVVEGVHFSTDADPASIGHKALARCLSDLAAMGGTPTQALVTLGLPDSNQIDRLEAIYGGMSTLAARYAVGIAGGETTRSPDRFWMSVAVLGWVEQERCVRRSGARPGDALFVTGELGGALKGGRHLTFEPRLREGQWLAATGYLRAMIDLSDGIARDVRHLLQASGVGVEILSDALPVSRAAKLGARSGGKTALAAALTDGEDFELLLVVPSAKAVALLDEWKIAFPDVRLSCVGKITEDPAIVVRDRKGQQTLTMDGYVHFQNS